MEYIDVRWIHNDASYPVRLVSELDAQRYEVRKLEFFRSGDIGYASSAVEVHGTWLGEAPVPSLEEINAQPEFEGAELEAIDFETLWHRHVPDGA